MKQKKTRFMAQDPNRARFTDGEFITVSKKKTAKKSSKEKKK